MAERLADGVWLLDPGGFPPVSANAYLLVDDEPVLVDTGPPWSGSSLRREVDAAGHALDDVDRVFLTHYDLAHVGGLAALEPGTSVYLGRDDARLASGEWDPPPFHHKGVVHRVLRRLVPLPDHVEVGRLRDGDEVGGLTAYHTPGHNPGHMAYVHGELDAGLLGDMVWEDEGRLTTPFWLDSYEMHELRESIRRFVARAPPFEVAGVAHGTPIRAGGSEALRTLADWLASGPEDRRP